MATHLPDLVQLNDLVPRIQTRNGYLGKDGLQEAHIQGTRFVQREMAELLKAIDARIREQIKGGVFPVRLKPEDWTSGNINWLLDVIAPDSKTAASVIGNFKQIIKDGDLRMHPVIGRLLDAETLEKMGARKMSGGENG